MLMLEGFGIVASVQYVHIVQHSSPGRFCQLVIVCGSNLRIMGQTSNTRPNTSRIQRHFLGFAEDNSFESGWSLIPTLRETTLHTRASTKIRRRKPKAIDDPTTFSPEGYTNVSLRWDRQVA